MMIEHTQVFSQLYKYHYEAYNVNTYKPNYELVKCDKLERLDLRLSSDRNKRRFCLDWGLGGTSFEPLKISGGVIKISGGPDNTEQEWTIPLNAPFFPFVPQASLYSPALPSISASARITINIYGIGESQREGNDLIASHFATSLRALQPSNVCFYFPRTRQRLWSNEDTLRTASPYFATLLSSDFAESSSCPSSKSSVAEAVLPAYTYDDSDEETDEGHYVKPKPEEGRKKEADNLQAFSYRTIRVVDTAYSTYLAVLLWITTRHISFAPLRSTFFAPVGPLFSSNRAAVIVKLKLGQTSGLPIPVSPKSVYRLAHLLELSDLSTLALSKFGEQLAPAGAVFELYTDASCAYPAIQAVALEYVVENWGTVKGSVGMKMVEQKIERGETSGEMALIGIRLAKKLMERYHK